MALHIHPYRPAAFLKVMGEDAQSFLQGQFTNQLRQKADSVVYGLWLNQKGKILADSHVLRLTENEFLVAGITSPAAIIRQRLEEYIVADDVTLADETSVAHGLALWGEDSGRQLAQVFGAGPAAGQFARCGEVFIFAGRRTRRENYEIVGSEKNIREARAQLVAAGGVEAGTDEAELARITAGLPAIPLDLGPGDLPQEGELEDAAISFTKGCYLGQEVMARLKNMGRVRRRLLVVQGSGVSPRPLAALYQADKQVGEIRSVAGRENEFFALAMLSLVNLDQATGLSLAPNTAPTVRTIPHG